MVTIVSRIADTATAVQIVADNLRRSIDELGHVNPRAARAAAEVAAELERQVDHLDRIVKEYST